MSNRSSVARPPNGLEAVQAMDDAKTVSTAWAMRVWRELPAYEDGERFVRIAGDDGEMRPAKFATLTETKRVLLTAIVTRWRQTKNETEADRILDFLRRLDSEFEEDRKMIESALHFGTDNGFPPTRAMRQYLLIKGWLLCMLTVAEEIMLRLLPLSWARNSGPQDKERVFSSALMAVNCSSGAFARLQEFASSLNVVDEQMRRLVETLQPSPFTSGFRAKISYDADNIPILTIRYGSNCFLGYVATSSQMQFRMDMAQERFREFLRQVDEWRARNGALKFLLVMEVADEDGDKLRFRDEFMFS